MLIKRNPVPRSILLTIFAALLVASPSKPAAAKDLVGTRASGMGGALRAAAVGSAAPLLNPAGMSLAKTYIINALYQFRGSDSASQVHASIVDSTTSRVAAALFYNFVHATPSYSYQGHKVEQTDQTHEVGLALSMALGSWLTVGATTRYINHGSEVPEDTPAGLTLADISTVTLDVGGVLRPFQGLNIAVVGYNLVPVDPQLFPQALGLGASYQFGTTFLAEFDSVLDFTSDPEKLTASFHGGAELFLAKRYAIRAGAMHDMHRDATYVTGGFGLVFRRFGLDFGLRQQVDGGVETLAAFSASLFLH